MNETKTWINKGQSVEQRKNLKYLTDQIFAAEKLVARLVANQNRDVDEAIRAELEETLKYAYYGAMELQENE